MHIKSILSAAAIALAATIGSASAADQFSTLDGIAAQAMTPQEMGVVRGQDTLAVVPLHAVDGRASLPTAQPVGRHDFGANMNGVRTFADATGPGGNH